MAFLKVTRRHGEHSKPCWINSDLMYMLLVDDRNPDDLRTEVHFQAGQMITVAEPPEQVLNQLEGIE